MDSLTDEDRAILTCEAGWWPTAGAKEEAIRDRLGMSAVRYYQRLNQLCETEAALMYDAVVVHRVLRLRSRRRTAGHG